MAKTITTVGHSNHDREDFLALLKGAGVEHVVDVRSLPFSRHAPHFNLRELRALLTAHGIGYTHAKDLGGRPENDDMYDSAGHVLYGRLADSPEFERAIQMLQTAAAASEVVVVCGEEDPTECHRRLLVGKVMADRGWQVTHLRGDGRLMSEAELADVSRWVEPGLFEGGEFRGVEIHTIGFTKRSAEDFFGTLKDAGIRRLIDVRLNNVSQLAAFAKRDDLEYFLRELVAADYRHEPLLAPEPDLLNRYRSNDIEWPEYEERFLALMRERVIESTVDWDQLLEKPTVLLCSEPTAVHCHRRLVVDYLVGLGRDLKPVHL